MSRCTTSINARINSTVVAWAGFCVGGLGGFGDLCDGGGSRSGGCGHEDGWETKIARARRVWPKLRVPASTEGEVPSLGLNSELNVAVTIANYEAISLS